MEAVIASLEAHGYLILLAVGFAEYAGVPIASVPVILAAGGLGPAAGLDPVLVAASAALGGLVADGSWYLVARWRGRRMVDAACGLTSNPNACVLNVQERVARLGPAYVLPSKFIPGAGNLVAPAAGLAAMDPARFLASDAAALGLWAGVYTTAGWIFSDQIRSVIALVERYQKWALAAAVLLVAAAAVWRTARSRLHGQAHAGASDGDDGENGGLK